MNNKIELLAPAGNYDAFLAAVENGANAVYLGGKMLNARQFAGNFDDAELERAIDYAHARGVKVLLTMNTLVLDGEMEQAVEYAGRIHEMGVDAFIVQDVGLAANLKRLIPGIQLHASTQMSIYNLEGVRALERMDFERVVLARELQLPEIRNICKNTSMEVEVFVHGALCISYSGQCLMSSLIGGRSGNRGKCAQPCRLPYSIRQDGKSVGSNHLLSPKDICYIDHLEDLLDAGVASLKIEGRMKSPEYVASVVKVYRKYLDEAESRRKSNSDRFKDGRYRYSEELPGKISEEDMHQLLQSFNRGGFSKGYLNGKTGPDMMAYEKPKNWGTFLGVVMAQDKNSNSVKLRLDGTLGNGDGIEIWSGKSFEDSPGGIITKIVKEGSQVKRANSGDIVWVSVIKGNVEKDSRVYKTSDKEMLELAAASYTRPSRKLDIAASFTLKKGHLPMFTLQDFEGSSVSVTGDIMPETALNKPLSEERAAEQLKKMGSTPFNIVHMEMDMDNDAVIPISELNNLRRRAAELLENKRITNSKRKINVGDLTNNQNYFHSDLTNNQIYFHSDLTYFPGNIPNRIGNMTTQGGNAHDENKKVKISAMLYHLPDNIAFEKIRAHRLYIPFSDLLRQEIAARAREFRKAGGEVFAYIPAIIKGRQSENVYANAEKIAELADGFLAGNLGTVEILRNRVGESVKIMGDYSLNVLNSSTIRYFKGVDFMGTALSYELNLTQLSAINCPPDFETEIGVYGKIPVMTSEYCPVGGSVGNAGPHKCKAVCKNGIYHLTDRKNAQFLVKCDSLDCRSMIFNSNVLFAPELVGQIRKTRAEYLRLSFVDESPQEIYDIVNLHRGILENKKNESEFQNTVEKIKAKGFTKGHFQRGVQESVTIG